MNSLTIARSSHDLQLLPKLANRHGLIAGATGTGKTVTLQTIVEGFSRIGTPVFVADVKGDLAGLAAPGGNKPGIAERAKELGVTDFSPEASPVTFWDVYGTLGLPFRTTISDFGPLLLSRLFDLNDVQAGVLTVLFKAADESGLLLLDLKDLQAILQFGSEHANEISAKYGKISPTSIAAIQRSVLALDEQGGGMFFGEPKAELGDLMRTTAQGRGMVNVLAAEKLFQNPRLYATTLLWLLSELYEQLPEIGDPEQPKLVLVFDEAHLMFDDAPKVLTDKIEQVVRLIRSKGVGVYFVTQNPLDLSLEVLGQLGNRVQHALRAFTPKDQKAVRTVAQTFRPNPELHTEQVITELGVGEGLISFLQQDGSPAMVERAKVIPPRSRIGALSAEERSGFVKGSSLYTKYSTAVDRESAYEKLHQRAGLSGSDGAGTGGPVSMKTAGRQPDTLAEVMLKSAVRAASSSAGRAIIRGVLGSLFGGRR